MTIGVLRNKERGERRSIAKSQYHGSAVVHLGLKEIQRKAITATSCCSHLPSMQVSFEFLAEVTCIVHGTEGSGKDRRGGDPLNKSFSSIPLAKLGCCCSC